VNFEVANKETTEQLKDSHRKNYNFIPNEKHPRPELKHYSDLKQSGHVEDIPYGIKTFD
jgi:hypothetical protein